MWLLMVMLLVYQSLVWTILKAGAGRYTLYTLIHLHCSWRPQSVVLPLILWLCDITLRPHVRHLHKLCTAVSLSSDICIDLHKLCTAVSLSCRNWISTAALLLLAVLAQSCLRWPIRADCVIRGGGTLKRQQLKQTEGGRQSSNTGQYEKTQSVFGH